MADCTREWFFATCAGFLLAGATACATASGPVSDANDTGAADTPRVDSTREADTLSPTDGLEGPLAGLGEDVDLEEVAEADREARRTVEELDEGTRREFLRLFGADPLGLSRKPSNAGRYEIPLTTNESVEGWIDYFQNTIPDRFELYLQRAGRYESMIRSRLREEGLPADLLYLALIESGMNPGAYSRARAVGIWQFMAGTGRMYDLEISYWLDERRDPVKATDAAIAHLSDLYEEFGSWYLAAAAYNTGAGRVRWGIQRTGSRDYWDLADARVLYRETRAYVPKLIAAATIAADPETYGFDDIRRDSRVDWDDVEVPDATSLDVIAEAAGADEREIEELNPQFRRKVTPPGRSSTVRVPVGTGERFATNYASIPESERVSWLAHTVTRGQTLSQIAARYGTSVTAIRAANDNVSPRRLQVGQRLLVPRAGRSGGAVASSSGASSPGPVTVVVRQGDTLWSIARNHDVSMAELKSWNNLSSNVIRPGDRITVRR